MTENNDTIDAGKADAPQPNGQQNIAAKLQETVASQPSGQQDSAASQPEEIIAGLRQQLAEEKAFSKGKIAELEKSGRQLAASQRQCEDLNDRLAFIAGVIEAKPEQNSGIKKFRKLMDEDYQRYANQNSSSSSGAKAMKTLQEVGAQLEVLARDQQILGKTIVAIGGAFSSGKSSFMNSLFSQDKVALPVGMDQTTAIASYVLDGENTEITGYSYKGARVTVPEKIFSLFTYRKKDEFKLNMKLIIDDIVFKTGFVKPYSNICFVDTPGFNPGSSSELDYNTAITAIAGAQVLLWCFDVSGGTIHDDGFTILQDILKENPDIKIYIIANRADLKSPEENAEIIEQAEMMLQNNSVEYEGISLYTSRKKFGSQPEEYASMVKGKPLTDFLEEYNKKTDTGKEDELLKLVRGVFDEYIRADDAQISDTNKKIQDAKSISSRIQYAFGKKDEIISEIKSHISQKELQRMGSQAPDGKDDTQDDVDAVSEIMEENMRVLQATLRKATADKAAAEQLCRKFEECVGSIFGDSNVHGRTQDAGEQDEPQDAASLYSLGEKYYSGDDDDVEQDYYKAFELFMKAAEQGYAAAENRVGCMYHKGEGTDQDDSESVKWYRKAAEHDNADAQNSLADMYFGGVGVDQNYAVAFKWYQKSAKHGNAEAQYSLGNMYINGQGVGQDYAAGLTWCKMSAEQGHAGAQATVGAMYYLGQGVSQDYTVALTWFKKAADQGSADAQNSLGDMYRYGLGVGQNYSTALDWYLNASSGKSYPEADNNSGEVLRILGKNDVAIKFFRIAIESGNAGAMNNLGEMYRKGEGVSQDYAEALKLFNQAADKDDPGALYNLAEMYRYGEGVQQDYNEAYGYVSKAYLKDNNNPVFLNLLGELYVTGQGTGKDPDRALVYFKQAADLGYYPAWRNIGYMYFGDCGIDEDENKALKYLKKAARAGDVIALGTLGSAYISEQDDDYEEFFNLLTESANRGNDYAQMMLGIAYAGRDDDDQGDMQEAVKWLMKSADQGNALSQFSLGQWLIDKVNHVHNKKLGYKYIDLAVKYLGKAAAQQDHPKLLKGPFGIKGEVSDFKHNLAEVARDLAEKVQDEAEIQEDSRAMGILSELYRLGLGVEKSLLAAGKWRAKSLKHRISNFFG